MSAVRHVAVVGRDAAAWLTALALRRAFAGTGLEVTVVEMPSPLRPVDVFAAVPTLGALHRLIGLKEADVLPRTAGVPVLGQRFAGWSGQASEFVHGYDTQRPSIGDVEFLQFWVMARRHGMQVPYEEFSVAAAAAKQGRVSREDREAESLGDIAPGYHLDARRYAGLLRAAALQLGVGHVAQPFAVEVEGERVTGLALADGGRIEADLYVDASGEEAVLRGRLPHGEWESWRAWLPCDRLLAASAPRLDPLPSFAHVAAFRAGWLGLYPLQNRTGIVAAYRSDAISDEEMVATASAVAGVRIGADAVLAKLDSGLRRRPWIGNCVTIGEGALALDPLDATALHAIHVAVSHLISLFPVLAEEMPEADGYNIVVSAHAENLRDFTAAHYRLNQREGEPFWDAARAAPGPASLDAKLSLFAARGQVPLYDEETFEIQNWAAIFIGHGVIPRDYTALVDALPQAEAVQKFQNFLGAIADEVRAMPSVAQYLAQGAAPKPERRGLY